MRLIAIGLSHKTAPVEVRERVAFPASVLEKALRSLLEVDGVRECAILSTCNRTEVYTVGDEEGPSYGGLEQFILGFHGLAATDLGACAYHMAGHRAVFHLFEVAAGLDSLVLGENEVLGQVKQAYSAAVGVQATGPYLNRLFHMAFEVGKRVRSETGINEGSLSVAKVGCRFVREQLGGLDGKRLLLVGAGETGWLVTQALGEAGAVRLTVTNRSPERGVDLAAAFAASFVEFAGFVDRLGEFDVVICATDAPAPIVRAEEVARVRGPGAPPLLVLDLAVPRDVEPAVGALPGIRLANVDDLGGIVAGNRQRREANVEKAFSLVEQQTRAFLNWYRTRLAAAAIEDLQLRFEEIRQAELYRHRNRFSDSDLKKVDELTSAMMGKMLSVPIMRLRSLTADEERDPGGILSFFKRIFGLDREGGQPG